MYSHALIAAVRALAVRCQSSNYNLATTRLGWSVFIMAAFMVNLFKIIVLRD